MATKKSPQLTAADFVHLHNHSHYSLLDGLQKIPEMVKKAKDLGMTALALTDHGTMSGLIEFYNACLKHEIKPILGMEAYLAARGHQDKDPEHDRVRSHLVILAMNQTGYRNMIKLSTIANLEGFYHRPRIDRQLLERYQEGLLILSGCMGSELQRAMLNNQEGNLNQPTNYNWQAGKDVASWYKSVFGDRYYIEIQNHDQHRQFNLALIKLARELDIKVVVTADSHYLNLEDRSAHEILLCVQTGRFLKDEIRMSLKEFDLHLSPAEEMIKAWPDHPEVITNTKEIADRCQLTLEFGRFLLPNFEAPDQLSDFDYLRELSYQGMARLYLDQDLKDIKVIEKKLGSELVDRLEYELSTIKKLGYASYFLIVWDFCKWSRDQNIILGPGRGSAAGSIVSYSLGITTIDPIKYNLLFERFLNPERIAKPDIDIDIEDQRRDEVIDYVSDKYGQDKVASIITFGRMAARNSIRDVGRVLSVPYTKTDQLARLLPVMSKQTIAEIMKNDKALQEAYKDEEHKMILDYAQIIEGTIRNHGIHAAGIVISPDELTEHIPLTTTSKGVQATQYDMDIVEDIGLLKIDFLGLSNLTSIKNALRIIRKVYGKEVDINKIPLDDKKTYELLGTGHTLGVFQLESRGMSQYFKQLKPTKFGDIADMIALYRPGPLSAGVVDAFIRRRHGLEEVSYLHPILEPILKETYGVLVYQEQVIQISKDICGFSGGKADTLRKAVGKKIPALMNSLEKEFIENGVKHSGLSKETMKRIWGDIVGFSDYGFNKSHSVSYGMVSYQMAWIKANFLEAFLASVMTARSHDISKLQSVIAEANQAGVKVLPPDINESFHEFAVVQQTGSKDFIRFSFDAIKMVGHNVAEEIINVRDKHGKFQSIDDFIAKMKEAKGLNKKSLESLIKAGAFDNLAPRGQLFASLDNFAKVLSQTGREDKNQINMFAGSDNKVSASLSFKMADEDDLDNQQKLAWEKELLGIYVSDHPLNLYSDFIAKTQPALLADLADYTQPSQVKIVAFVVICKKITTKTGKRMVFLTVEDRTGQLELTVFHDTYQKYEQADLFQEGKVLQMTVRSRTFRSSDYDQSVDLKWQLEAAAAITDSQPQPAQAEARKTTETDSTINKLIIKLNHLSQESDEWTKLKEVLAKYRGPARVEFILDTEEGPQAFEYNGGGLQVDSTNPELLKELTSLSVVDQAKTN